MLSIDNLHVVDIYNIPKLNLIIETWFINALSNNYNTIYNFTDISTSVNYKLSPRLGVYVFIKLLLNWLDVCPEIDTFKYNFRLSHIDKEELLEDIWLPERLDGYIAKLIDMKPIIPNVYITNRHFFLFAMQ